MAIMAPLKRRKIVCASWPHKLSLYIPAYNLGAAFLLLIDHEAETLNFISPTTSHDESLKIVFWIYFLFINLLIFDMKCFSNWSSSMYLCSSNIFEAIVSGNLIRAFEGIQFSNFSCMFLNPNIVFFQLEL